jgi:hypothetical protein
LIAERSLLDVDFLEVDPLVEEGRAADLFALALVALEE